MEGAAASRGWIESPRFDLAAFILVPLSSLVVLGSVLGIPHGWQVVVLCTYLVAIPHYLSSFSFFFGDDNLAHYKTRSMAFFLGPAVILASVIVLRAVGMQVVVANTLYVWNVWHVSLQSAGILAIYRRLNRGPVEERPFAMRAILLWNATLAFWFIDRYAFLNDWLVAAHPAAPLVLRYALLAAAIMALVQFRAVLRGRAHPLAVPEKAFLASSFALFLPYLWVRDSNLATFAMLMGHFIQYLSIVWLLNRRKYSGTDGTTHQRVLGFVSHRPLVLMACLGAAGVAFYAANRLASVFGVPWAYATVWNALALVHFYLDGLIWAFRKPFVRESIGTYLMPPARLVDS